MVLSVRSRRAIFTIEGYSRVNSWIDPTVWFKGCHRPFL